MSEAEPPTDAQAEAPVEGEEGGIEAVIDVTAEGVDDTGDAEGVLSAEDGEGETEEAGETEVVRDDAPATDDVDNGDDVVEGEQEAGADGAAEEGLEEGAEEAAEEAAEEGAEEGADEGAEENVEGEDTDLAAADGEEENNDEDANASAGAGEDGDGGEGDEAGGDTEGEAMNVSIDYGNAGDVGDADDEREAAERSLHEQGEGDDAIEAEQAPSAEDEGEGEELPPAQGVEDDFTYSGANTVEPGGGSSQGEGDEGEGTGSDYDSAEEEEEERSRADLIQAEEEKAHLLQVNRERHKKILLFWERDKQLKQGRGVAAEEKLASGQNVQNADQIQAQYMKTLDQLNVLWDNLDQKREGAEEKIDRLTAKLDRQDEQATELSDSFKAFKREIAREARHSRTDQPVKLKRILAFEASEEAKDREVAEVRLKHINLLSQLKQLEEQVKEKEELAEGLHLIDFEQLKIENQTLNEKIEERNDELHKLRKKTTTTVQVLTHIKEKLQFVQQENTVLDGELGVLETSVAGLRDRLTQSKKVRDHLRASNTVLKEKQGFIGSDLLVGDFEGRKGTHSNRELDVRQSQVNALKLRHAKLLATVAQAHRLERQYGSATL